MGQVHGNQMLPWGLNNKFFLDTKLFWNFLNSKITSLILQKFDCENDQRLHNLGQFDADDKLSDRPAENPGSITGNRRQESLAASECKQC